MKVITSSIIFFIAAILVTPASAYTYSTGADVDIPLKVLASSMSPTVTYSSNLQEVTYDVSGEKTIGYLTISTASGSPPDGVFYCLRALNPDYTNGTSAYMSMRDESGIHFIPVRFAGNSGSIPVVTITDIEEPQNSVDKGCISGAYGASDIHVFATFDGNVTPGTYSFRGVAYQVNP